MASASEIRIRINSIRDTKKVTDAMYMISSVKMRKAKREHDNTEPYFRALREEIGALLQLLPDNRNRFFKNMDEDGIRGRALVVITSDKGMAGSYNQNAIRLAEKFLGEHDDVVVYAVGEYGKRYFQSKKVRLAEDFESTASEPSLTEAQRICMMLLEAYLSDRVDKVDIVYTAYRSGREGICRRTTLLPLNHSHFYYRSESEHPEERSFLTNPDTLLNDIVPSYLTGFLYSALVDSFCSEQEARMTAMQTAGTNAEDMLKKLQLQYNAVRQAAITSEMTEIAAGAKALQRKRKTVEEAK